MATSSRWGRCTISRILREDRIRRREAPGFQPARPGPMFAAAALARRIELSDVGRRGRELSLQEVRCPVERRTGLIEEAGKTLEYGRDAGGDLEGDRDVGEGCPFCEPERVAQEDLVRSHLDEERRQSVEIAEDRADERIRGVRSAYVVRYANTEPGRCEDRVERFSPGQCLSGERQIRVRRHQRPARGERLPCRS